MYTGNIEIIAIIFEGSIFIHCISWKCNFLLLRIRNLLDYIHFQHKFPVVYEMCLYILEKKLSDQKIHSIQLISVHLLR